MNIMENITEKQIYDTRVIPFVKYEEKTRKGKKYIKVIENLSKEEIKNMSCEPRMLWEREHVYVAELPLAYNEGTGIKWALYYVFSELTKEEQEKYIDRSIVIPMTRESVVKIYGESSKRFFGKKKVKERK